MAFIPTDTRNQYKTQPRDSLNFPPTLPSVAAEPVQNHFPIYDRNMFMNSSVYDAPQRNVQNDRLFQTTEIYRNFGEQQHDHFLRPANPHLQQQTVSQVNAKFSQTRERRDEKMNLEERRNMDRTFMTQRNYGAELSDRFNGFNILPRDTRFETTKKVEEVKTPPMQMRSNRYLGNPANNF